MERNIPNVCSGDGLEMPAIGFGTYRLNGAQGVCAIENAIKLGYRLLDSAVNYENEGAVGRAIRRCGLPREELLVTSKLPGRHHRYAEALNCIEESLYRAGLDYFDLYLIHWPNPKTDLYVEAWQAMIEAKKRGYIRFIGVSNFMPEHLERIIRETGVTPSVNQIELHPYFNQEELRAYDTAHGIITESWSPLGRGSKFLSEPILLAIAQKNGKTPHQVVLRWHTQLGVVPIPKASSLEHQRTNLDIFDFTLTDEDMKQIGRLTSPNGRISGQNPFEHEEF
jgi:diketogulonate reductase-like aldo/keto reductase